MSTFFWIGVGAALEYLVQKVAWLLSKWRCPCEECEHLKCVTTLGCINCKKFSDLILRPKYCGIYKRRKDSDKSDE